MSEKKIQQLLELCLWFLNPILILLAIYINEIQPALFLQWLGKFHPLVLHFPIVFGILIVTYFLFFQRRRFSIDTEKLILTINAFIAVIVAICGLLLSKQNSYDGGIIDLHKWGGIAIAILSWIFVYILNLEIRLKKLIAIVFLVVLMGSSHKGAQLTHGVNVLDFPKPSAPIEQSILTDSTATVYELGVAPVLAQKCISCHGAEKMKGDLQLNTPANILKGGKNGAVLQGDLNKVALLLERIHLPQSDEEHMPPDGKSQLTADELAILSHWIKGGSDFKIKLNELAKEDSLRVLISKTRLSDHQTVEPKTNLPDLKEFNSNYCTVNYLFNGSADVEVNFFQGHFYDKENLKKLTKIKGQIVSLNMQGMPLAKEDLNTIIQFTDLQKVNLNYTGLDMASLEILKPMTKLRSVSICGIEYDETSLNKFLDRANFASVNIWSNNTDKKMVERIVSKYPAIKIVAGDNMEDELVKISTPTIEQDSSIISNHLDVNIKHLLKGTVIRYTTDGTDPDSLKSMEYTKSIRLTGNTVLKVKAFRPGWISSDIVQRTFYKSEIHPDTIYFITNPDPKYSGIGAKTLIDYELGESNSSNGKWLAYKDANMEFVIGFHQARQLSEAHFNTLVNIGGYILPPTAISVQGSNDGQLFKNISEVKFPGITKNESGGVKTYSCVFPKSTSFKYYKFIVFNVKKLPAWHAGKGTPAWIFVDELFLN